MKTHKPTDVPAALKHIDVKALLRSRGVYLMKKQNEEFKKAAVPIARLIVNGKKRKSEPQRHLQFTNEVVMAYWEKQIHIVEVLEARFDTKVQQFIKKIVSGFLSHLDSEIATNKKYRAKDFFDDSEDEFLARAQLDFTPLLVDQVVLAGQEAYKLIGLKDIYLPDKLRAKIAQNVEKFTHSMLDTDRDTLVKILTDGLADGKSVPEIRSQIQADFEQIEKNQAQRITRTEVLRASNQGAIDAYEQSGIVEGKQWLTAGATDECSAYEGQIVTLHDNFYGSDNEFQDGDPPLHPNCRCVVLPVVVDEKAYRPDNATLFERIKQLEGQLDKRTKSAKELMGKRADDAVYIKSLEKHLGLSDEPPAKT